MARNDLEFPCGTYCRIEWPMKGLQWPFSWSFVVLNGLFMVFYGLSLSFHGLLLVVFYDKILTCFQRQTKDGAESVLPHKSSYKNSNILLHKSLSAPSFGRYLKQPIRKPFLAVMEPNWFAFGLQSKLLLVKKYETEMVSAALSIAIKCIFCYNDGFDGCFLNYGNEAQIQIAPIKFTQTKNKGKEKSRQN